jgi:nucleotide-binding universal stress UspA family protein
MVAAAHELNAQTGPGFGQVLCATDFSPGSMSSFHHALKLALASRGRLDIVHVDSRPGEAGHHWQSFPGVRKTLADWGVIDRNAPETAVAEALGLHVVKTDIAAARPAPALAHHLAEQPSDLVVVGTHSRENLSRIFHPSVAEPVVRAANRTALFVPEGARPLVDSATGQARVRQVLIPIDREPASHRAVQRAITLAGLLGQTPEFRLLHVGSGPMVLDGFKSDPRFHSLSRPGPVVDTIISVAAEFDVDLIVMATAGHDGLMDAVRGSTTEQVLRRACRPLLAVPA